MAALSGIGSTMAHTAVLPLAVVLLGAVVLVISANLAVYHHPVLVTSTGMLPFCS
jgi:hypothetical protein